MSEAVRQVLMPLWNSWTFLSLYANAAGHRGDTVTSADHVLDRYALAKTRALVDDLTARLDAYDISGACGALLGFVDSLNNWYIRRSRDRFWAGDAAAIDTLHTVLMMVTRVAAPLLPLVGDRMYRGLTGGDSVHLTSWPSSDELPADPSGTELVRSMDAVREVCSVASSVRKANGIRNRQPLASVTVAGADARALEPFADLIADEVNVKRVAFGDTAALGDELFEVDLRAVGPRLGPDTPKVLAAMREGNWSYDRDDDRLKVLDHTFGPDEFTRKLVPHDAASTAVLPGGRGLVRLDLDVSAELSAEGTVRDVVRAVNQIRRHEALDVSDRVRLVVDVGDHDDVGAALAAHRQFVETETLAVDLVLGERLAEGHRVELPDGRALHVGLSVVSR
jgi:isoleucyl-tRNA synthetase